MLGPDSIYNDEGIQEEAQDFLAEHGRAPGLAWWSAKKAERARSARKNLVTIEVTDKVDPAAPVVEGVIVDG